MKDTSRKVFDLATFVAAPIGYICMILAGFMTLSAASGPVFGQGYGGVGSMLLSAGVSVLFGFALIVFGRGNTDRPLRRHEALVAVAGTWVVIILLGALPFLFDGQIGLSDSIFESTSGFTTTGATILPAIESRFSYPLLCWRQMTHWLGGMGIIVLFVAIFPVLGVGSRHLFKTEVPGPAGSGLLPRVRHTATMLWKVYLALTLVQTGLLFAAGLDVFQSLMHAMTTVSTGGFSPRDASFGAFNNPAAEMVVVVFMLLGGTNFAMLYLGLHRGLKIFAKSSEFRLYVTVFSLATVLVSLDTLSGEGIFQALRFASFQVASLMTGTGLGTADYEAWPGLSTLILVLICFTGGMAGSTSGGMKMARVLVLGKLVVSEIRQTWRPNLVSPVQVDGRGQTARAIKSVAAFATVFVGIVGFGALIVGAVDDVGFATAASASLACVANVGPGFGAVGPTENYGHLSAASKGVLTVLMLLGRLEFFALLSLFSPRFWRR